MHRNLSRGSIRHVHFAARGITLQTRQGNRRQAPDGIRQSAGNRRAFFAWKGWSTYRFGSKRPAGQTRAVGPRLLNCPLRNAQEAEAAVVVPQVLAPNAAAALSTFSGCLGDDSLP